MGVENCNGFLDKKSIYLFVQEGDMTRVVTRNEQGGFEVVFCDTNQIDALKIGEPFVVKEESIEVVS